jgi:hypothetical protein
MSAILPNLKIDRDSLLSRFFTPYQLLWIFAEDHLHAQNKQAVILATLAHTENRTSGASAAVLHETGWSDSRGFHPYKS